MAEYDYVVSGLNLKQSAIFKLEDVYKVFKTWISDHGYKIGEREYSDTDRRHLDVKWICFKKVNDYIKYTIEIRFKAKDLENIAIKNKRLQKGEIEIRFDAYLETDYEDFWEERGTSKFMRGVFDKISSKKKMDENSDELKEDTYNIYNEIKSFLGMHVFR